MPDEINLSDGSTVIGGHALRSTVPVRGQSDTLGVFVDPGRPTLVESTINDAGALGVPGVKNIAAMGKQAKEQPAVAKPLTAKQKKKAQSERAKEMWAKRRAKMAGKKDEIPDAPALASHSAAMSASAPMRHDAPEPVEEISPKGKKDPYRQVLIMLPDMREASVSDCEMAILDARKLTDVYAQTLQDLTYAHKDLQCEFCRRVIRESQGERTYSTVCPIDPNGRAGRTIVFCSVHCHVTYVQQHPEWKPYGFQQVNLAVR